MFRRIESADTVAVLGGGLWLSMVPTHYRLSRLQMFIFGELMLNQR